MESGGEAADLTPGAPLPTRGEIRVGDVITSMDGISLRNMNGDELMVRPPLVSPRSPSHDLCCFVLPCPSKQQAITLPEQSAVLLMTLVDRLLLASRTSSRRSR